MKAPPFDYARPDSLAAVFALLAAHGEAARLLAGGQSLLATLGMRLSAPALLIDLARVPGLAGIEVGPQRIRIGAMTTQATLERAPEIKQELPLLAAALPHVAHPAIRNRGTLGGSLAFADPAAELPACAVALEAELVLASAAGERRVAAGDFYKGLYETELRAGEVLVAAEFPRRRVGERWHFAELARRHGDYALVGLAAQRGADGLRLVFFGAGNRPVLAAEAARRRSAADAAAALDDDLDPPNDPVTDAATRRHLAKVLLRRAWGELTQ